MHDLVRERQDGIRGSLCGCFYCLRIYDGREITSWVDDGTTALCPYCGIDSVLSEYERYGITKQELERRRKAAFES